MGKVETTRKALTNAFPEKWCVSLGYCELQDYLKFFRPTFFTHGIYGWNFDGYLFDDILITTGYRGMIGKRLEYDRGDIEHMNDIIERERQGAITTHYMRELLKMEIYRLAYNTNHRAK